MKNYFKKFSIMFVMALAIIGFVGTNNVKADEILDKYVNAVPKMTSNTSPTGIASCDNNYNTAQAYKAFDGVNSFSVNNTICAWGTHNTTGKLSYEFPQKKIISAYILDYNKLSSSKSEKLTERPKEWTFDGWDGEKWIVLDSRTVTDWQEVDKRIFEINNATAYIKYQINIVSNNGCITDPVNLSINELELLEKRTNPSISLNKSTDNLQINQTDNLVATTTPEAVGVTWKSSDPSIATVDSNGKVTGVKEGTCTIAATATDGSDLSATCAVTVTPKGTEPNPNSTDSDKIVNIAHAKGDNTNNPGGDVTIIFHGTADTTLSVVKTADVKDVWVGDTFTYTIVVTNTGTKTAKAVVVNDPSPNHIDFVVNGVTTTQGTVDSSSTSKNIIVNVGDIPPLGTVTIKVPATVIL